MAVLTDDVVKSGHKIFVTTGVSIVLPVGPEANHYYRKGSHGQTYRTPEALEFKELVWGCAMVQAARVPRPWFPTGDLTLKLYWFRKAARGDVDNRLKPLLDALQWTAYENDRQVRRLVAERVDRCKVFGWPDGCYVVCVEPFTVGDIEL